MVGGDEADMTVTAAPRRSSAAERRQAETNRLLAQAHTAVAAERQRLLDEVVVANLEVARSIAGRYRNRGIAAEDLEQVACLGLVQAANRFDPTKADDFLSYAVPTIRGDVRRHFRVTVEQVREARTAQGCFQPTSLDTPVGTDRQPLAASLVHDEFDEHAAVEARVILRTLTRELSSRDRLILYLRFVEGRTQAEIGEEIGVTQMQVSRLLDRILRQMRARAIGSGRADVGADRAS
jgi:RNA polymerase sigma-B factor